MTVGDENNFEEQEPYLNDIKNIQNLNSFGKARIGNQLQLTNSERQQTIRSCDSTSYYVETYRVITMID
jgi:hypothetical protein